MRDEQLTLVESFQLPFLLSVPQLPEAPGRVKKRPLLVFLHGLMEGPPTEIYAGLTAHGPLRQGSSPLATSEFIVAAPQLPARGDIWRSFTDVVSQIVGQLQDEYGGDPARTYLTGFSFGGNGVFEVALATPSLWAALWPVDPTRVPESAPLVPVWLSSGEASRPRGAGFISKLALEPPRTGFENRVYVDEGLDHVGTATSAYRDDSVYRWLLSKQRE